MNYQPPQVNVDVLDNPRIINTANGARLTAIVGVGPTILTIVDEAIVRASGSVDNLSAYPGSGCVLSQVASLPGVNTSDPHAILLSLGGALYQKASASLNTTGQITWSGSGTDIPTAGTVYYASYVCGVPASQYLPTTFYDKKVIQNQYGMESNTTGILTIAGAVNLENGAPGVILVQAASVSVPAYNNAIDLLQKLDNIEQIVCVFPSGSVTRAQQEQVLNYAFTHTQYMNSITRDRGLMSGSPSSNYASGGFDTIGNISTSGTYLYRANTLKNADHTYVVPSNVWRYDQSGNLMLLDGNFLAAAIAGLEAAQPKRSTPLHGRTIAGLIIENDKWFPAEMDQLGAGNCLVVQSHGSVVTIRDAITTDPTSADTQEISVRAVRRLVKKTLTDGLSNVYTSKGLVILPETPSNVASTTASLLQSVIGAGEIADYGKQDNPATGETQISAQQDPIEPRKINVTCSYFALYPLKWIFVTCSTYIG